MLPYACVDSLSYTDEFHVFYSVQTQDLFGAMKRSWVYDRVDRGYFAPAKFRMYEVAQQNTWEEIYNGQTEEDVRIDSQGKLYSPSEIMIAFKTPKRIETAGPRKGLPTLFEIRGSVPVEGPFGEVLHFNTQIYRSIDQLQEIETPVLLP
jgi:hypothetical protein